MSYYAWNWFKSLWWYGGGMVCKPILVFSLGQAEQLETTTNPSTFFQKSALVKQTPMSDNIIEITGFWKIDNVCFMNQVFGPGMSRHFPLGYLKKKSIRKFSFLFI